MLYTVEVLHIIASCGLIAHCYADDTQLNISVPVSAASEAAARLAKCIERLDLWMAYSLTQTRPADVVGHAAAISQPDCLAAGDLCINS